jgi:hydroxypyruvate isomerase
VQRFAANLGFLFAELPLLARFEAAHRAGFMGVEIQGPGNETAAAIASAARDAGVEIVLCNAPVGDFLSNGSGLSGVPGRQAEFREAIQWVGNFAWEIGCGSVNIGPSRLPSGADRKSACAAMVENLQYAGDALGGRSIRALIEPLSSHDFPGTLLSTVDEATAIVRACGHSNVHVQFDIYHMHQMHSDALVALEENLPCIGHLQFADAPGRGAPGTGAIDFDRFFGTLDRLGYSGWIGAEYRCGENTEQTLAWLERYGAER